MTLRDISAADLLATAFAPVKASVLSGLIPGAALGIALKDGGEAMAGLGYAVKEPAPELLDLDTVFDLASLTKVMLTTPAILALVDRGAISLDDTLGALLPGIPAGADHGRLTVAQCLGHQTFLPWHEPLFRLGLDRDALRRYVLERDWPHGASVYSDINFILLGMVIEAVTGRPLGAWPLPPGLYAEPPPDRTAATELDPWRGRLLRGEVHDENAFALGPPAGHAGLFGTLPATLRFAAGLLDGTGLSPQGLAAVRRPVSATRTLGFERRHDGWAGGDRASPGAIGHTGFTGTGLWVDFEREVAWVLLTNRVHPSRHVDSGIVRLRRAFNHAAFASLH
ncbi:MAG: serine hydrolase domain-containing protein [Aestuariivirgaceae bacterium]